MTSPWARVDAGDGVVLRRPVPDDAPGVLSVHGDPRVYELDPHLVHTDPTVAQEFLAPPLEHWEREGGPAEGSTSRSFASRSGQRARSST